jgi:hypothetical protein
LKSISLTTPSVWQEYDAKADEMAGISSVSVEGAELAISWVSILTTRRQKFTMKGFGPFLSQDNKLFSREQVTTTTT